MLARHVAVTRPTYPHPMTVTSIAIHLTLKTSKLAHAPAGGHQYSPDRQIGRPEILARFIGHAQPLDVSQSILFQDSFQCAISSFNVQSQARPDPAGRHDDRAFP